MSQLKRKTISLSSYVGLTRAQLENTGVFDATLGIDTKLFVDPKLLIKSHIPEFRNSRKTILQYFAKLLKIHRQSHKSPRLMKQAQNMLAIPEPRGLSIGYGNKTDKGIAIPRSVANRMLLSASEIMAVGIDDEELIELLGLFVSGFGPDSISDLIISIVYKDFCAYTARIAKKFSLSTNEYTIDKKKYKLPKHPFLSSQIIFVPHPFLSPLPVAVSWDEIAAAAQYNAVLRTEINQIIYPELLKSLQDIKSKTDDEIQSFREDFNKLLDVYKRIDITPYDLKLDPKGYYALQPFVDSESKKIGTTSIPKNQKDLVLSVRELIQQFQRSIEDNAGNTLLYRKNKTGKLQKDAPHHEDVAQILFYLVADLYCQTTNILLTRESNAGLGPVDFSLGTGYHEKIIVEIKKSTNKELKNGYLKQVKAYEKSEKAFYSFYVVILVKEEKDKKKSNSQLQNIKDIFEKNKKKNLPTPELIIIDGLIYPSPSKLRQRT